MPWKKKQPTTNKNKVVSKVRTNNNEGSIFKRSSDGLWVGSITVGYDDKGRQVKKVVYGKNRATVAKNMFDISGRIKSNSYEIVEKRTFGELMGEWLMVFKKSSVTPRTFDGIIRNYKLHIEPQVGNMKVYEIDTYVVQRVINNMIDKDYSVNTIKKINRQGIQTDDELKSISTVHFEEWGKAKYRYNQGSLVAEIISSENNMYIKKGSLIEENPALERSSHKELKALYKELLLNGSIVLSSIPGKLEALDNITKVKDIEEAHIFVTGKSEANCGRYWVNEKSGKSYSEENGQ